MSASLSEYPEALKVGQAAKILQVSEQTVRRWITDGTLPVFRVRGQLRVPRAALERLIAEAMRLDEVRGDANL